MSSRRLRWLILGLGLALAVVIEDYFEYAEVHGAQIQSLQTVASRTWVRDKLLGRPAFDGDAPYLPGLHHDSVRVAPTKEGLLMWIVDPSRCVDCLAELPLMRELVHRSGIKGVIVLSGKTNEDVVSAVRRAGTVALDTTSRLLERYGGGVLSGVIMFVDPKGVILAAEGYSTLSSCDWRFVASIGALLGHVNSTRVRRRTTASPGWENSNKESGDD